jgi:polysaccharide biosynthesis/export protein
MSNRVFGMLEVTGSLGRHSKVNIILALALGFLLAGQQAALRAQDTAQGSRVVPVAPITANQPTAPSSVAPPDEYLINPGDELDIYVFDVPELSHTYTVSPSGVVSVPLLPQPIQAQGLTPNQFARAMEQAFKDSGRLRRPEIAVSLKASLSSSVAVEGAVRTPLIVPEVGRARLVDIITKCGGLTDDVGTYVTITRGPVALRSLAAEGGESAPTLTVELKKIMDVTDPASATAVWPGDRVNVERQKPDVYYVLGEVKTPGGYTIKNGQNELTVLRAIALAGDVTSVAKTSRTVIIRKDPKAPKGREEIKVDLKSILTGKTPDPLVVAEDILFVPSSNSKKALHTLESAPGLITAGAAGAVIH